MHVARLLRQYDLPSPHHLLTNPPGRTSTGWKMQVKEAIRSYWMKELIQDVGHKITARFLSKDSLKCGTLHPLWNLTPFHLYDIRQACIKAKMLAGVYCTVAEKYTHLLAFQISCSPSRKTCSPENFTCSLENFTCSPENFTCSPENFTCSPQHFTSSPVKCSYWPAQFNFPCAHLKLMAVQT